MTRLFTPFAVGIAWAVLAGGALAQAPPVDGVQAQFAEAMQALESGRAHDASPLLAILAARTDAPRIRLELARALYLQGRLKEAREQFLRVYLRGDLPYAVRRTINVFLADIDQRVGHIQPSFGLAVDSNPLQTPPSGLYDIFGMPLAFESEARTETGVRLDVSGAAPLGRKGWSLVGATGVTRFSDPDLGQYTANVGLRRLESGRGGWWGVGATYFERIGFSPASTVYVERVRRITLPDASRQLVVRGAISRLTVKDQPHLEGWGLDAGADYAFDLTPNVAVGLNASAGAIGAEYAVDRRRYANLAGGVTAALPTWNKAVSLRASGGATRFGDTDPFFGRVRDDRYLSVEARLLQGRPIHGLFPSVSVTWEQRISSIAFFNYERTGFSAGLQRRF